MDVWVFLFFICTAALICLIRLLRPNISIYERAFLVMLIATLAYVAYNQHTQYQLSIVNTEDKVSKVLSLVQGLMDQEQIELTTPIKKILESDPQMLRAVLALIKYARYDKDNVLAVIVNLIQFYQLYADILLEIKDVKVHLATLVDNRYKILRLLHSLFVTLPNTKHIKVFEHCSLILQAATYKCLNVLKNKYGTTSHEPPLAENMFENTFEMF